MRDRLHSLAGEFETFILRGNIIALVEALASPLIAAIFGEPDFAVLTFTINHSVFRYGEFINAMLSFVLIAAAVFFIIVRPVNRLVERDPTTTKCPECLSTIPIDATRCASCAIPVQLQSSNEHSAP